MVKHHLGQKTSTGKMTLDEEAELHKAQGRSQGDQERETACQTDTRQRQVCRVRHQAGKTLKVTVKMRMEMAITMNGKQEAGFGHTAGPTGRGTG